MPPACDPFGVPRLRGLGPPEGGTPNGSIILWTGPKHSGKTSSADRLVQAARGRGFIVAGCLAPSLYADGVLLGFDLVNLRSGARAPLARRSIGPQQDRSFHFLADGLSLGNEALGPPATEDADLILVDEYGPWELKSQLWRHATDRLVTGNAALRSGCFQKANRDRAPKPDISGLGTPIGGPGAVLLLVVREELVDEVLQLYAGPTTRKLAALAPESVAEVLTLLENRRRSSSRPE